MREILILLKKDLRNTFGIDKLRKTKPIKLVLYALLALYIMGSIGFSIAVYANIAADFLLKYNLLPYMIIMFIVLAFFSCFMFTVFSAKARLFDNKDNDLLFSMPIKSKNIYASRFISILVWNLAFSLIFIFPSLFVYISKVSVMPIFYLYMFFIILLLTIIPTALASIFGYIIAKFTSMSKSKNLFEIILSLLFIFGLYYFMSNIQKILLLFTENKETLDVIIKYGMYPIHLINKMLINNDIYSLLIYIGINVLVFFIFINIFNKNYKQIISKLHEQRSKKNYKMKQLKASTQNITLIKKEARRYFSSPIYVLNTAFGLLMLLIMAGATFFYSIDTILSTMEISVSNVNPFIILVIAYAMIIFLSNTTSSSISMEGKNFWLMKSLPIKYSRVLNAKILFNIILVMPVVLISAVVFKFTLALSIVEFLLIIILSAVYAYCSSQFGLIVNLKFPKMDALSDEQIVKRSASSIISILVPLVILMALASVITSLKMNNYLIAVIVLAIFIILAVVENIILKRYGIKQLKKLEV